MDGTVSGTCADAATPNGARERTTPFAGSSDVDGERA